MILCVIGCSMVGSYILLEKDNVPLIEGTKVKRGNVAGEFRGPSRTRRRA